MKKTLLVKLLLPYCYTIKIGEKYSKGWPVKKHQSVHYFQKHLWMISWIYFVPDLLSDSEAASPEELIPGLQASSVENTPQETGMLLF